MRLDHGNNGIAARPRHVPGVGADLEALDIHRITAFASTLLVVSYSLPGLSGAPVSVYTNVISEQRRQMNVKAARATFEPFPSAATMSKIVF